MPPTAAALRLEIETTLSRRIPGALSPRPRQTAELFPTGIEAIDALLDGGIPRGGVSEIIGLASTGRTALSLSAVAALTRKGAACAWVDVQDALDPESAAACGIALERLLWVRVGSQFQGDVRPPLTRPRSDLPQRAASAPAHGNCSHPRNETRDLDRAVSQLFRGEGGLLRDKRIGTPGMANRPLADLSPRCAEPQPHRRMQEQVSTDRLPPRRGEAMLAARHEPDSRMPEIQPRLVHKPETQVRAEKPWPRLEKALKATDLLLQAGGFSMIVLDMSDLLAEQATRVPLATWYRFRLAAEQAQTALILLAQVSCAKSCASLVLECGRAQPAEQWAEAEETALFEGLEYRVAVDRRRAGPDGPGKKPAGRVTARWSGRAQWIR